MRAKKNRKKRERGRRGKLVIVVRADDEKAREY